MQRNQMSTVSEGLVSFSCLRVSVSSKTGQSKAERLSLGCDWLTLRSNDFLRSRLLGVYTLQMCYWWADASHAP